MLFFLYQLIISILIIFSPFIIIYRIINNKEDKFRFKEKFCFFSKKKNYEKLVWFHGSSVGEIMSILPIIQKFEKKKSISKILITSSTLSSSKILNNFRFKKVIHQFYPVDHLFFSNKFLNHWKPSLAIFLESEIWPSMFKSLRDKDIPLILLNARITPKTFFRWKKLGNFSSSIFKKINIAFPQNNETKNFLKKLNVENIDLIGNLKFIENEVLNRKKNQKKLFSKLKKYKMLIAASTHDTEEVFIAKAHLILKKKYKNLITVMIPRHVHRVKKILDQLEKLNLNVAVHSSNSKSLKNIDIYLVDTFGENKYFYQIATTVFLGGSIIKHGGQNPIEPARFGAKILHGPNIGNFKEVYNYLEKLKISQKINGPTQLTKQVTFKKNMRKVSKINYLGKKIFNKTIKKLDKYIYNEI